MMFLWLTALITVLVLALIVYPLWRSKNVKEPDTNSINAEILKTQINELETDLKDGVISTEQYEAAKADLEQSFVEAATEEELNVRQYNKANPVIIVVLVILLPTMAYGIYDLVGTNPQAIQYAAEQKAKGGQEANPHQSKMGGIDVAAMVERVRKKANANPQDIESWRMLARSLHIMRDLEGAANAYRHLIDQGIKEADIYSRYADVLASAQGGITLDSPAYDWTLKALDINPKHQQSLWIAGSAAFYSKNYDLAEDYWNRLLKLLPEGSEGYMTIKQNLMEVSKARATQAGNP
ncbi:MAG: c-type cytochrome biogenesis protein CcmI [Hydrogenovibrio sp.]|uniref:c-type cytochrome biogenesis protein CcmI n=1 Tax=Hydrogenovibrio sp. TaxID=2065821 RepID=UPI0028705EA7|nr:c-type cytochrome biogenesis protein CcmI [Hydrogenovibrio sp.]MDR9499905.1 c-type cytochrome biogenesis protein CcmI [Hydrogenovibrio sp.]